MTNKKKHISLSEDLTEMDETLLNHRLRIALNEPRIAGMEKAMRHHFDNSGTLKKIIRVAAVWIVILSVSALPFYLRNAGKKGIFNDYYAPYNYQNISGIYRGQESGRNAPFLKYTEGNFTQALPLLRQFLIEYPADTQARLLVAMCLIEDRQFDDAELELTKIIITNDYYFREDALWYLALLSVRTGDFEKARSFLEPVKNNKVYGLMVQSLEKAIPPRK